MLPQPRSQRPYRYVASVLAAVLAGSAVLAGCGAGGASDDASASVDPYDVAASVRASATAETSGGASASARASLSPGDAALRATALAMEAPDKPAAMSENTPEGAVAAAEYFISLYPYVYATGDLTEWDAMCSEDSAVCASVRSIVEDLHGSGGWADPWTDEIAQTEYNLGTATDDSMAVRLEINTGTITRHYGDGQVIVDPAEKSQRFEGLMTWTSGHWEISDGGFQ